MCTGRDGLPSPARRPEAAVAAQLQDDAMAAGDLRADHGVRAVLSGTTPWPLGTRLARTGGGEACGSCRRWLGKV